VTVGVREGLPQPMAVDGVVTADYAARTLAVRLPDSAGGHAVSLWRQAYGQLRKAEEGSWRVAHPTLWGGAFGDRQVVHGKPGDFGHLVFHFPPGVGVDVYSRLVGKPRLAAIVVIDRSLCQFMSVQFIHRD
jgi:hypothetical protein